MVRLSPKLILILASPMLVCCPSQIRQMRPASSSSGASCRLWDVELQDELTGYLQVLPVHKHIGGGDRHMAQRWSWMQLPEWSSD